MFAQEPDRTLQLLGEAVDLLRGGGEAEAGAGGARRAAVAMLLLAAKALGPVPYPCRYVEGDLLGWAEADGPVVDVVISGFAVHHLQEAEKERFLRGCRRRLAPGGLLLWADVFRPAGESREAYVARYFERVHGWTPLEADRQEEVIAHPSAWDHPADRATIEQVAAAAGWQWRWIWQGHHDAEALGGAHAGGGLLNTLHHRRRPGVV